MSPAHEITGPIAALVAGMVTSLHCVAMCGPLACAVCVKKNGSGSLVASLSYHAARILSYTIAGVVAGFVGRDVAHFFSNGTLKGVAWIFIGFFLIVALGLDKRFPLPPLGKWASRAAQSALALGPFARPATLGLLTPFIPCMALYLIIASSSLSGSAFSGGVIMAAFGLGSMPLLFFLQSQYIVVSRRVNSAARMEVLRRSLAVISVVFLTYRVVSETGCPFCQ